LDEVGELPLDSQAKLLRVLEERKIDRLGGRAPIALDFRLVTATNRDLGSSVKTGKFRSDLYYRINEFPIEIPPLRSRPEDIPLLARHFLAEVCRRERLPMSKLSEGASAALMLHDWPGNVRELRSLMRQMVWKAQGLTIEPHHLPPSLHQGQSAGISGTLEEQLIRAERAAIESTLQGGSGAHGPHARNPSYSLVQKDEPPGYRLSAEFRVTVALLSGPQCACRRRRSPLPVCSSPGRRRVAVVQGYENLFSHWSKLILGGQITGDCA
jgi:DNA-binding NtrC family response regulator